MNKTLEDYINSLLEEEERKHLRKFVEELTPMVLNANKGMETQKPKTLYYENSYKQPSIYTSPNTPILQTAPKNLKTNTMLSDLKNTLQNTSNKIFNQQKNIPNLLNNTSDSNSAVTKTSPLNQNHFNLYPMNNVSSLNDNNSYKEPKVSMNNSNTKSENILINKQLTESKVSNMNINKPISRNLFENSVTSESPNWIMPCEGRIVGEYGEKRANHTHNGIDIAVIEGTPIKAIADGTICAVGAAKGYGYWVGIDHGIINGVQVTSEYGHISRWCVSYGQKVKQGQIIAYSGNTGESQGPHCHLTIRNGNFQGISVNPWNYIHR